MIVVEGLLQRGRYRWLQRGGLVVVTVLVLASCAGHGSSVQLAPGDVLEAEQWLVGHLDGQAMANLHVVVVRHEDGTRTSTTATHVVLQRSLLGREFTISMRETNRLHEDADGMVQEFTISQEEMGRQISAVGTVRDGQVQATVHRSGESQEVHFRLADDVVLLGQEGMQRRMVADITRVGERMQVHSLGLVQGRLVVMDAVLTCTARDADGTVTFDMRLTQMPQMTTTVVVGADGLVRSMHLRLGPGMEFTFAPAAGPARLGTAALSIMELVTVRGPAPRADQNRYRLLRTALEQLPEDAFQRVDGDLLLVTTAPRDWPLEDPQSLLVAEPHVETDDPQLQAWVARVLGGRPAVKVPLEERIALLIAAVQSRLSADLSIGDLSAAEAYRAGRGDCTEYSNLLTAALRIAGIPARVEVGFVYAVELGGWGGHAWVSAYDQQQGRWLNLDAAYPNVPRSCYIRTGSVGGEHGATQQRLDQGMGLLLGQTIEVVP